MAAATIAAMEKAIVDLQAEIRRRVQDAGEQLRRQLRVRQVVVKRDGRYDVVLPILRVVETPTGVIVEVAESS